MTLTPSEDARQEVRRLLGEGMNEDEVVEHIVEATSAEGTKLDETKVRWFVREVMQDLDGRLREILDAIEVVDADGDEVLEYDLCLLALMAEFANDEHTCKVVWKGLPKDWTRTRITKTFTNLPVSYRRDAKLRALNGDLDLGIGLEDLLEGLTCSI